MDPITHGLLGASLCRLASKSRTLSIVCAISAMAPDLDILIRSEQNPLLHAEMHRHFSHSFLFGTIAGAAVGLLCHFFSKKKISFKYAAIASITGFFSHGILDACTSFGTLLFWPFSYSRISLDLVSIVDPIFSGLLLLFCIASFRKWKLEKLYVCAPVLYFSFCVLQHNKVLDAVSKLALDRGHTPTYIRTIPTLANSIAWRTIYEYNGYLYIDGVRSTINTILYQGSSAKKLDLEFDFRNIKGSILYDDLQKMSWICDGLLTKSLYSDHTIIDVRYGVLPHKIYPHMLGFEVNTLQQNEHLKYKRYQSTSSLLMNTKEIKKFLEFIITGKE